MHDTREHRICPRCTDTCTVYYYSVVVHIYEKHQRLRQYWIVNTDFVVVIRSVWFLLSRPVIQAAVNWGSNEAMHICKYVCIYIHTIHTYTVQYDTPYLTFVTTSEFHL